MAEEFQAGICGENWWNLNNSSRSVFPLPSSPCSLAANYIDAVNFSTWQADNLVDLKHTTRSCEALVSDTSLGFLDEHKTKQSESSASMGSTWTSHGHSVFGRASESKFHSVVEEAAGIDACNNSQVSTISDALKPMNHQQFSFEHQSSDSYGYGNSKMMQSLYDHHPQPHPQPQADHSLFTNRSMAYSYNQVSPIWPKVSPFLKPSMPKQHLSGFPFSNNTTTTSSSPFWNASALHDVPPDVFASSPNFQYPSQTFEHKPKNKREEAPNSTQVMNKRSTVCEPDRFKRPRIETPSPLPTFKVRKEKLGDRITALQQLVSPFGKTDTASVLHEAIEYIKYLHDQVSVLSTPYMKNGASIQQQQGCVKKESEEGKADLRSQGLCLVPISSTFPVANCEITAEIWTPPVLMR